LELGQYITVWWDFGGEAVEHTYLVEAVTDLGAISPATPPILATRFFVDTVSKLPRFRARVAKSFDIEGFDNTIYRPPIGVQGDVAVLKDMYWFCPDGAVSKSGEIISVVVEPENLEIVNGSSEFLCGP
jgi:hypothetical protein